MIRAVADPAQKQRFLRCVRAYPALGALLGQDLALWADNPGAPVRLFVLPGGALVIEGKNAWLCGGTGTTEGWEELRDFLRFVGVERLRGTAPTQGWAVEQPIYCYGLAPGEQLPLPAQPDGTRLDRRLAVGEAADFLFDGDPARRNDFYAATCPAAARGLARLWALRDAPSGRLLCTVGAYAMQAGEAYMAMGQTLPERRGQGLGGWLIAGMANELAAEGWQVTFLCKEKRRHFYETLGFHCLRNYYQYKID